MAEATELALRLARGATGNRGIICTDAAYHGNSSLVGRLSRLPHGKDNGGVRSISTPQRYRPIAAGLSEQDLRDRYLDQLQRTIAT